MHCQLFYVPSMPAPTSPLHWSRQNELWDIFAKIKHNFFITWRAKLNVIGRISSIQPSFLRALLAPFDHAGRRSQTFDLRHSYFYVLSVVTFLSISRRLESRAFVTARFSIVTFLSCSFSILENFNSFWKKSRRSLNFISMVWKPLSSVVLAERESVVTSVPSAMTLVEMHLPGAILTDDVFTQLSSIPEIRTPRPHALCDCATCKNRVHEPSILLVASILQRSIGGRSSLLRLWSSTNSIFRGPNSSLQSSRSMKIESSWNEWTRQKNIISVFSKDCKAE